MYYNNTDSLKDINVKESFNKYQFPPNSEIRLYENLPFKGNYKDVLRFSNETERKEYFDSVTSHIYRFDQTTYLRKSEPIKLPIPFDYCYGCNYMTVTNYEYPTSDGNYKTYYYFIEYVEYANIGTSKFYLTLDVFQTYLFDYEITSYYCIRKHCYSADTNHALYKGNNYKYLNTEDTMFPEDFESGSEYKLLQTLENSETNSLYNDYCVAVYSGCDLGVNFGTVENPKVTMSKSGMVDNMPSAYSIYIFPITSNANYNDWTTNISNSIRFDDFMSTMSEYSWITQNIAKISVIPTILIKKLSLYKESLNGNTSKSIYKIANGNETPNPVIDLTENLNSDDNFLKPFGYHAETKMYCYPYSFIECTLPSGDSLIIKPEYMSSKKIKLTCVTYVGANGRIIYTLNQYCGVNQELIGDFANPDNVQYSVSNGEFPSFPILNDNYQLYMAMNANTINAGKQANEWNYDKANMSVRTSQSQLSNTIKGQQNEIATAQQISDNNLMFGIGNAIIGGATNAFAGNYAGMISGIATNTLNLANERFNTNANISNMAVQNSLNNKNTQLSIDMNRDFASGDYENAERQRMAKINDAKLIPPSTIGLQGGDATMLANHLGNIRLYYKQIYPSYASRIKKYWHRFGYAVNTWVYNTFKAYEYRTRTDFDYIQMGECRIENTKQIPNDDMEKIRKMWQGGVTIWHNKENFGNYSLNNYSEIQVNNL